MLPDFDEILSRVWLVETDAQKWRVFFQGTGLVGTVSKTPSGRFFDTSDPGVTYNSQELAVVNIVVQAMEGSRRV